MNFALSVSSFSIAVNSAAVFARRSDFFRIKLFVASRIFVRETAMCVPPFMAIVTAAHKTFHASSRKHPRNLPQRNSESSDVARSTTPYSPMASSRRRDGPAPLECRDMSRVDPPSVVNIADLRAIAKKRLPRVVFDYIDGGAGAEWTMRENARVFDDVMFRPRSAVATASVDLRTTVLGETIELPFLLAPVGSSRLFWPRGEEVAARAAGEAGTIYTLSTLSGCTVRDVKAATRGPVWYQLYLVGGRDVALAGIERAKTAGCSALVVTVDTPVAGMRERDVRNGAKELISGAPFTMFSYLFQFLARPRWLAAYLRDGGLMNFPNV